MKYIDKRNLSGFLDLLIAMIKLFHRNLSQPQIFRELWKRKFIHNNGISEEDLLNLIEAMDYRFYDGYIEYMEDWTDQHVADRKVQREILTFLG